MSQQPTFQITKEHFVGVINSLHQQYLKDKVGSDAFGQIFNAEAGLYDNSLLINSIFSFLHEVFPKDEDGFCNISHYCYECNFGKIGDNYESPEELYDRLILAKGVMWFDTASGPVWCHTSNLPKLQEHQNPPKWLRTPKEILESVERNNKHFEKMVSDIKPQNEFFIGAKAQDYPIAPEDAKKTIVYGSPFFGNPYPKENTFIIDEACHFQRNENFERAKGYWRHVADSAAKAAFPHAQSSSYKGDDSVTGQARAESKPSPDETA